MYLGIDFGTTNSSIALFDDQLFPVMLDSSNDNPKVLPSLIYIDRGHNALLGSKAAEEYLERETGRPVKWERRHVGEVEVLAASPGGGLIHYWQDAHTLIDTAANGRLLQSIKTGLRDPDYNGTMIFDRFYPMDELISIILEYLKIRAESQFGRECYGVVLGRPVRFSDQIEVTQRAEEILFKAARLAGFNDIRFQLEPIGALHLHHRSSIDRHIALVFDFGGGTLDLTIAEVGGRTPPKILSTTGVLVGGDDLDKEIMRSLLKYFGEGSRLKSGDAFPTFIMDMLDGWQNMPTLSQPRYQRIIDELLQTSTNPAAIQALKTLITQNLGFELFREIERAKKRLSSEEAVMLRFSHGHIDIRERITRQHFEAMISEEIGLVEEGLHQILAEAELEASKIDVVLRTGGTSLVPAFIRLLAKFFGIEKLKEMEPLTSVVGGLAILANERGGWSVPYGDRYVSPQLAATDIRVKSGKSYELYKMNVGAACYMDSRSYIVSRVPVSLTQLPAMRTAFLDRKASSQEFLRFDLRKESRVYVAYDAEAKRVPNWLRSFDKERPQIELDQWGNKALLQLYSRTFMPGTISLGGNLAKGYYGDVFMNYIVIIEPKI